MPLIDTDWESEVRYYSRIFPAIFSKAKDSYLFDREGNAYLDFFCGAGTTSYGHNNKFLKKQLINYIKKDGISHSLDMSTEAKINFIDSFQKFILSPRSLNFKIQFTSPSGTDTIEAALKLARKYTKRKDIIYFSNSYHGMSMGSLSVTPKKVRIGIPVGYTIEMPFYKPNSATNNDLEKYLNSISESEYPAAIILETIQAEGGINVASVEWLQNIEKIAKEKEILLIIDDVQAGVGRTGDFFSFERANIKPDLICLSKAISGFGQPLALLLINPEFDIWEPGEHTGTFRGNNLAFVTANEALIRYWQNDNFLKKIKKKSKLLKKLLTKIAEENNYDLSGIGMIYGLNVKSAELASQLRAKAFQNGLIFETCGPNKSVLKLMAPLTISKSDLVKGIDTLKKSLAR